MTRTRTRITLSLVLTVVTLIATAAVAATPASAGTTFKLMDTYSDTCMIDPNFSVQGGSFPVLGTCGLMRRRVRDTTGANEWMTVPSTQGVKIRNAYTGHCLQVVDDVWPRASRPMARLSPCSDSPGQNWEIAPWRYTSPDVVRIRTVSVPTKYCLAGEGILLYCGYWGNLDTWLQF